MLKKTINPIALLLTLFGAFSVFFAVALSLQLRPIADDYCWGATTANYGFWGALNHWITTWTGDYTGVLSTTLFTGVPLAILPFEAASATTFLITQSLLGILGFLLYWLVAGSRAPIPLPGILFGLLIPSLWLVFWWSTSLGSMDQLNLQGPRSITHWQNINSGYVILLAVALIWLLLLLRLKVKNRITLIINGFGIGVWLGGSGLVISLLGGLVAFSLLALSIGSSRSGVSRNFVWLAGPWFLSNTIGWLLAYTSSGTRARRAVLGERTLDAGVFLDFIFPKAIIDWVEILVSPGTILVFVLVFIVGGLLRTTIEKEEERSGFKWSGAILLLSLILSIISQAASFFSYDAFWHVTPSATLIFVSITVFSLVCGRASKTWLSAYSLWPRASILLVTVLISVGVLNTAFVDAQQRLLSWDSGPAPLTGMSDIEATGDWVDRCWRELGEFRDIPIRQP